MMAISHFYSFLMRAIVNQSPSCCVINLIILNYSCVLGTVNIDLSCDKSIIYDVQGRFCRQDLSENRKRMSLRRYQILHLNITFNIDNETDCN